MSESMFAFPDVINARTIHDILGLTGHKWRCPLCDETSTGYCRAIVHLIDSHRDFPRMLEAVDASTEKFDCTTRRVLRARLRETGYREQRPNAEEFALPSDIHEHTLHTLLQLHTSGGTWTCPVCGVAGRRYRLAVDHMAYIHRDIPRMDQVVMLSINRHVVKARRSKRMEEIEGRVRHLI